MEIDKTCFLYSEFTNYVQFYCIYFMSINIESYIKCYQSLLCLINIVVFHVCFYSAIVKSKFYTIRNIHITLGPKWKIV